jgi:cellobiose phosphorylase
LGLLNKRVFRPSAAFSADAPAEDPLREELLSIEQLEQLAAEMSAAWPGKPAVATGDRLLPRLAETQRVLLSAYQLVNEALNGGQHVSPAAEWLLDNYYLVEEQILLIRRHLPRRYSLELPQLSSGPLTGFPRVYGMVLALISHLDGRIDSEALARFTGAYQKKAVLTMGELWAVPIMLRLALVENLRRVASRIREGRYHRNLANEWADKLIAASEESPDAIIIVLAEMVRAEPPLSSAFTTECVRRLEGHSASLGLALDWLAQMLARSSKSLERMRHEESQRQAADHVLIANCIGSLHFIDATDWKDFVESQSVVEQSLARDPAGSYRNMDFRSRDRYRHEVENLAKWTGVSELRVADQAIDLASRWPRHNSTVDRRSHVGYYLVDRGRRELETALRAPVPASQRSTRVLRNHPLAFYHGLITMLVGGFMVLLVWGTGDYRPTLWTIIAGLAALLAASQVAIALANYLVTLVIPPSILPRMDFSTHVPDEYRTLVVVPTIVTSPQDVADLLDALEVKHLANRDKNILLGLLTDFSDANQQVLPGDEALLRRLVEGIEGLNRRFATDFGQPFYLFHRPRLWNDREKLWMGYERKRGKLTQLVEFLRGRSTDAFLTTVGDMAALPGVQFVITLDTDTELPRGTAAELIGAMAHPLNRPVFNPVTGIVTEGYGILQPRVAIKLTSASRSWFSRLYAGDAGVDPYTLAVSDVYQDLFGQGSFIGKGIIDVDAFDQSQRGRFAPNRILSHDLLEGCHVRSGLISDALLFEDHPWHYGVDADRRHRWIRGDWQIVAWLFPWVKNADLRWQRNALSLFSRWKIFDNLRRSLVPLALLLVLMLALAGLLPNGPLWLAAIGGVLLLPGLLVSLVGLIRKPDHTGAVMHVQRVLADLRRHLLQAGLSLTFLPDQARLSLDATIRALTRMYLTRRRLLEWRTSSAAQAFARTRWPDFLRSVWAGPAIGLLAVVLGLAMPSTMLMRLLALLLGAIWIASPLAAWLLSRPITDRAMNLHPADRAFLLLVARATWNYFDTHITAEDHYLPPDNFQQFPNAVLAHRTSPTNIGLALLANVAARDFGWISTGNLLLRTRRTFDTLGKLEKYRGHFLNWYDTLSLAPLNPRYISTVDSGNLAAHLLVLAAALRGIVSDPAWWPGAIDGLDSTLLAIRDSLTSIEPLPTPDPSVAAAKSLCDQLQSIYHRPHGTVSQCLAIISESHTHLHGFLADHSQIAGAAGDFLRALERQHADLLEELRTLAPWLHFPLPPHQMAKASVLSSETGLSQILDQFNANPPLADLPDLCRRAINLCAAPPLAAAPLANGSANLPAIDHAPAKSVSPAQPTNLRQALEQTLQNAEARMKTLSTLADESTQLANMDFVFLYDKNRKLLSIGFSVTENRMDAGFYDLLASEARIGSYVGIVLGQLPQENWFSLGRQFTSAGGDLALISWSGSMFEYLMPELVLPSYRNTILDTTNRAVVQRNIEYGRQRGIPWGISESGYNATDAQLNYQYKAFGVPGLGFRRRLAEDTVIAPYASAMALLINPPAACANLRRLAGMGMLHRYGFYEALDYTPSRLREAGEPAMVQSYMVHHQGMSLLGLEACLLDHPMQRQFLSDPLLRSGDFLLQERSPHGRPVFPHAGEVAQAQRPVLQEEPGWRSFNTAQTPVPEVHLVSNGRYHLMITAAGGSRALCRNVALTRWREDFTRDCRGVFCYIRDLDAGLYWSNTHQPVQRRPSMYEATFSEGKVEFRRRDGVIETFTQVVVSPEDDLELRRIRLTNRSKTPRRMEVTSYAEVVLQAPNADLSHPAFGNLFVQTEAISEYNGLLATRRARSKEETPPWLLHSLVLHGAATAPCSWETDRMKFVGRGRTPARPLAMDARASLSNTTGAVLDPIIAIRREFVLQSDQTALIDLVVGIAGSRADAVALLTRYNDSRCTDRVLEMAWSYQQVLLRQINATEADAQIFGRLAGPLVYGGPLYRGAAHFIRANRAGQSGLWGFGISGDLPILLLRVANADHLALVRKVIQAHAYWRLKGLAVDMMVWIEDSSVYRQALHQQIMDMIAAGPENKLLDRPGGIFVRRSDQLSEDDRTLLLAVATVVLNDSTSGLERQIRDSGQYVEVPPGRLVPVTQPYPEPRRLPRPQRPDLQFFNSIGGLTPDHREYVMDISPDRPTPAPWCNVLANGLFGTVISERGGAYTWAGNAHEFRLTPWYNDPVSDVSGEAIYIRDDHSGAFWSPTPGPVAVASPCVVRHGFGYSVFQRTCQQIESELWVYVAVDKPVKFNVLKLTNKSDRPRRISVMGYWEWTLGEHRDTGALHILTELDEQTGTIFAANLWNGDWSKHVAFVESSEANRTLSGDRTEFLGRNGGPDAPAAMGYSRLSGRLGVGLDPCAAMHSTFDLPPGGQREVVLLLGAADSRDEARALIRRFRSPSGARRALDEVWKLWNQTLGTIYLETPDPAANALANGWLPYQVLSSRLWARSGYYQSGGAFGFRDQLQDAMAMAISQPAILRAQLLRTAGRQFVQGDVQHWWHPPTNRGVRTRVSDDLLWLPLAVARYVQVTHDTGVLDEPVEFLHGRPLNQGEESWYDLPQVSGESASLYEHCLRAIRHAMTLGRHGIPLMGSGDWNDGLNRVGLGGQGESVWLGFFLRYVLAEFEPLAQLRQDTATVELCRSLRQSLAAALEANCWDGQWYMRAFFDDGSPLGSHSAPQCRIDSLPQSWAVLSATGSRERQLQALASVKKYLICPQDRLIKLFDPPFDHPEADPGYIAGYVPGVRENGGQYTHAAIWVIMAFAQAGLPDHAWELFSMINPLRHSANRGDMETYRVEPYVVAADVYAVSPYQGQGGWTWYTGSAGWMYRLLVETFIGLRRNADRLSFEPALPSAWKNFRIHFRYFETFYHIYFSNGGTQVLEMKLDGVVQPDRVVPLVNDRREHRVDLAIAPSPPPAS